MSVVCREPPAGGAVRAVTVVLHGLNLSPARMDDWSLMLRQRGTQVVRVSLHGHSGNSVDMSKVHVDVWRDEFDRAVAEARADALKFGVPLHFVGYSLGALVCLEWMSRQPEGTAVFDSLVFAAPALSLPWYSRAAIGLLSMLGPALVLPSRTPRHYRANRGTSIGAYRALFALKSALEANGYRNANQSTLILIDRRDELIDSREIARLVRHHHLERWTLTEVDNDFARRTFGFRHMLVDEESMGRELWASVATLVTRHLGLAREV